MQGWIVRYGRLSAVLICAVFFAGCSKPQQPAVPAHKVELHPVRPPSDQPNISVPIGPTATATPENRPDQASRINAIEKVDMDAAMGELFLNESGANSLEEACKDTYAGSKGVYIDNVDAEYGDLDGDGKEEAVVTAFSCASGTGGPDLFAVFKLDGSGKLRQMRFEPKPVARFNGRDIYQGLRGKMRVLIKDGTLIEQYPVFKEGDANCCATGGVRQFFYKWNDSALELERVVDLPEAKDD